jgi:hypothetical protein
MTQAVTLYLQQFFVQGFNLSVSVALNLSPKLGPKGLRSTLLQC